MIARFNSGKTIRGILNYNEAKVKEGVARCIDAVGFGCAPEELSFRNKLARFTDLTTRNKITQHNAVHVSLSFHPDEHLTDQTLQQIAAMYMEKIGFGDQPYLVYRHTDTANEHIHIATVNIRSNGKRINTHYIGANESSEARRAIEEEFRLIKAEEQEQKVTATLKPADLSAAKYGKRPTKNEISNVVRSVAKYYRYTNFKEYSDILKEFNVLTDRGKPGTRTYEAGGLMYQLLDKETGKGVGVSIKASSIYEKPTLKEIEGRYEINQKARLDYRERVSRTIDKILKQPMDPTAFVEALKSENIIADFKRNEHGYIYGISYIDKTTCCFFNGSDIGKNYSAKAIQERLQTGTPEQNTINREFVEKLLTETDFSTDVKDLLTTWTRSGALVKAFDAEEGTCRYKIGHVTTDLVSFVPADERISRYLFVNGLGVYQTSTIIDFVLTSFFATNQSPHDGSDWKRIFPSLEKEFASLLQQLWQPTYSNQSQPVELLREARKKKKQKRY